MSGSPGERPQRSLAVRIGLRVLQVGLTVAVTWFLADRIGFNLEELGTLDAADWRPDWLLFAGASVVLMAGYLLSAVFWGGMVAEMGGRSMGVMASARVYFTANLGRYVPGKIWQIAGLAFLARREGVAPRVATGAAILGQATSLAGASLIALGLVLGGDTRLSGGQRLLLLGVLGLLLLSTAPTSQRIFLYVGARLSGKEKPEGLLFHPGFGFRWVVLYALNWIVYVTSFWMLALSFGLDGTFLEVGPSFAAAYVLGYLAFFAPAGMGVREVALGGLLRPVMGEAAWGLAIVARLWMTVGELIPTLLLARGHFVKKEGEEGSG